MHLQHLVWCFLWTIVHTIRVPSTWNQYNFPVQNPFFPQSRSDQFIIPAIQPSVFGLANHDKYKEFQEQQLNHIRQFVPSPSDVYLQPSTTERQFTVTEGYRNVLVQGMDNRPAASNTKQQNNGADRNRVDQWDKPLRQNYRDDKLHEPAHNKDELPPVPTKPLYPGEGLWAVPGLNHQPHISQHKFLELNDQGPKPAGYDVFAQLNSYFDSQKTKFDGGFGSKSDPEEPGYVQVKPPRTLDVVAYDPFKDSKTDTSNEAAVTTDDEAADDESEADEADVDELEAEDDKSEDDDDDEEEFVPIRLYSQVRKSEDVDHEPYNPLEHGRLREVIKDSKVQTVYTEEGYEDSAYDHAGHEKKAEQDQGSSQFERQKEGKDQDSVPAASGDKANNFISTEEVKTTQVMDKDNGDVQLEIESEVKMVLQPNNTTKTHKYVKIYPKVVMDVATTPASQLLELHHEINDMAIDSTTQSSTVSFLEAMTKDPTTANPRPKRSSGSGFEDVDIDLLVQKEEFAPPKPEIDVDKYPYYLMDGINDNSPLRYAENMDNIPEKTPGELSFYKDMDKHPCPDPETIDPIPDKVIKAKRERRDAEEDDEVSTPPTPRIHLGDKIDCLKTRYFGDEPLDSPFFKEETVGPVVPLFKELNKAKADRRESMENDKAESVQHNVVTPLSLMTTPKYTLQLTPENIYDQIKLLDHLPESRQPKALEDTTVAPPEPLRRRRLRKRPYQIFDVNRYLTTTPFTLINPPSTVLPKHKVLSEVFYKDDIKPNEQLTVFADVLNIIRNSSVEEPARSTSDFAEPEGVTMGPPPKPTGRRKTTTTSTTIKSTNIHVPSQSTPSNHQPFVIDYVEDNEVIGLVPPNSNYKTIADAFDDRDIEDEEKPVTEDTKEVIPRPMNKYYFIGLKPPLQTKVPYSDHVQINDNLLLRRIAHVGLNRVRRAAARPYADLSRNRGSQSEGLHQADEEDDDYVPHRPKNYHYDEKTGRIVYHSKAPVQEEEEEDEELIPDTPGVYLERAEDATHPTPEKVTTKELLATATPPPAGQGLMDFILKLKNSEGYKFIPDPTTRKPGEVEATTEGVVTQSTKPPEFLHILSRVKADKNYKTIEDPKEVKGKSKTTTAEPEELEEEEEEEETKPIQNSPGGQNLGNIEIFDIGDYLPKVKTFTPRTTIDYSKYKTINRPHRPMPVEEEDDDEEEVIRTTSTTTEKPRRGSIGKPLDREEVTTRRTFNRYKSGRPVAESKEVEIYTKEPTTTQKIVQHRRGTTTTSSTPRKRPSPSLKTTTDALETTEKVQKVYPENYSPEPHQAASHDKAKRVYRRRPVRIRHTTERDVVDKEEVDRIMRRSIEVDEFKEALVGPPAEGSYDKIKEEILNDKMDEEEEIFDKGESMKEEVREEEEDEEEEENDDNEQLPNENGKKDVEIIDDDYDKNQKHGGNYRQAKEETQNKEPTKIKIIDKQYDQSEKHGGNYKEEEDDYEKDNEEEKQNKEEIKEEQIEIEPVKIITNQSENAFDDTEEIKPLTTMKIDNKKINYEQENVTENNENTKELKKPKDVEIINKNYDKTKHHGGNYKATDEIKNIKRRKIKKKTQRLSDVVPKPDHFYTDPLLPKMVNQLRSTELSSDELSQVELSKEVQRRNFEVATKKPLFIKDPSKRLYFYAAI